jgi:hypothetical protein
MDHSARDPGGGVASRMMEQAPLSPKHDSSKAPVADATAGLTSEQLAEVNDQQKQAEYRREYLAQLQRRACPGCGETDTVY